MSAIFKLAKNDNCYDRILKNELPNRAGNLFVYLDIYVCHSSGNVENHFKEFRCLNTWVMITLYEHQKCLLYDFNGELIHPVVPLPANIKDINETNCSIFEQTNFLLK